MKKRISRVKVGNLTNYEKASEYGVKSMDLDKNPHFFIQM